MEGLEDLPQGRARVRMALGVQGRGHVRARTHHCPIVMSLFHVLNRITDGDVKPGRKADIDDATAE